MASEASLLCFATTSLLPRVQPNVAERGDMQETDLERSNVAIRVSRIAVAL